MAKEAPDGRRDRRVDPWRTAMARAIRPLRTSLRLRILSLVGLVVLSTAGAMGFYTLNRFEAASVYQLEHEGLLLSDLLEAAILPLLSEGAESRQVQDVIDVVSASREQNDIEINVLLKQGYRSSIIASNIPDNIELSSVYEHRDMLAALERGEPIVFVGRDDDSGTEPAAPRSSPDYYILPGHRFISITTPLQRGGEDYGSINTKLSLAQLDEHLSQIELGLLLMGVALPAVAVLLFVLAIRRALRPLDRLTGEVAGLDAGDLGHRFSTEGLPDELRPITRRLNELLARIEDAVARERRFTADVAHELRTPIATLKTMAEVELAGLNDGDGDSAERGYLEDTLAIARQMEELVVNLLGLVRCEAGAQEVAREPVDLRAAIASAWEAFEPQAAERGLHCEFEMNGSAVVETDRVLLGVVLRNLFSNAVRYCEHDGRITGRLERASGRWCWVLANSQRGLREEDLEHLFEPFWRKESARTDGTHAGIGLALVRTYAELLGMKAGVRLPESGVFQVMLEMPAEDRGEANQEKGGAGEAG